MRHPPSAARIQHCQDIWPARARAAVAHPAARTLNPHPLIPPADSRPVTRPSGQCPALNAADLVILFGPATCLNRT